MSAKRSAEHYRWNDERIVDSNGYAKVRAGIGHPLADPYGYAYEHLVVWVSAGNPRPESAMQLHHRNGVKTDNRIENLELVDRAEHARFHSARQPREANGRFAPEEGS